MNNNNNNYIVGLVDEWCSNKCVKHCPATSTFEQWCEVTVLVETLSSAVKDRVLCLPSCLQTPR